MVRFLDPEIVKMVDRSYIEYLNYSNIWATLFQIHIAEKPNLLAGMEAY